MKKFLFKLTLVSPIVDALHTFISVVYDYIHRKDGK